MELLSTELLSTLEQGSTSVPEWTSTSGLDCKPSDKWPPLGKELVLKPFKGCRYILVSPLVERPTQGSLYSFTHKKEILL